jgi:hypothetical protein
MSATMNSAMFSEVSRCLPRAVTQTCGETDSWPRNAGQYFGGCPIVEIPGFTHAVDQHFLEDALELTGVDLREANFGCVAVQEGKVQAFDILNQTWVIACRGGAGGGGGRHGDPRFRRKKAKM